MVDLTPIVNAVIAVIAAVITIFLIPWLRSQTTEDQRRELSAWIQIAVSAAEQIYAGPGRGTEKKLYVQQFLESNGYTVDTEAINAMIEAAVKQISGGAGPPAS
jgi:type II secretory pathway pseudopilin PulG